MTKKKTKWCPKCKDNLLLKFFAESKTRSDGLQPYCKVCCVQINRDYRKTEKGKAAALKYAKSPQKRACRSRYNKSEKGKLSHKKHMDKATIELLDSYVLRCLSGTLKCCRSDVQLELIPIKRELLKAKRIAKITNT